MFAFVNMPAESHGKHPPHLHTEDDIHLGGGRVQCVEEGYNPCGKTAWLHAGYGSTPTVNCAIQ
jgi:hypothetical protein